MRHIVEIMRHIEVDWLMSASMPCDLVSDVDDPAVELATRSGRRRSPRRPRPRFARFTGYVVCVNLMPHATTKKNRPTSSMSTIAMSLEVSSIRVAR